MEKKEHDDQAVDFGGPMVQYVASLQHLAALLEPEWLSTPAIAKNLKWLQRWCIRIRGTNPKLAST